MKHRLKVIRDPVHGDMELPVELFRLIDTPQVQRLRGVRQLGTACFVYPGALHTRFDHSLGTCWLASRLIELLGVKLSQKQRLAILAYALLHDVSHLPYGHTLEDERRIFERHDTPNRVRLALTRGDLGRELTRLQLLDPVLEIAETSCWQQELIAGAVGADLLDYLARDAYFCGLHQTYDPRIFSLFRRDVASGTLYLDCQREGVLRHDALSEIVHLLRLRYFLSERVYFHHTKTASGAMISRAVEEAIKVGLTLQELTCLTDEGLWSVLESRFIENPSIVYIMKCLRSRRLYKRVFLLTAELPLERRQVFVDSFHVDAKRRAQAEADLAASCHIKPHQLIIYCPTLKMQLKEGGLAVKVDDHTPRSLQSLPVDELALLQERHRLLWRFYVFLSPEIMNKAALVGRACEAYFGEANHLPLYRSGQLFLGI